MRAKEETTAQCSELLVLVLSSDHFPYDLLRAAQERTWASANVPGVEVRFYQGGQLPDLGRSLARSLERALEDDWTHLFRTNSSSYVDLQRLLAHAQVMPKEKLYAGVDGGGFASGSGFLLSRDAAENLHRGLGADTPNGEDDVLAGKILQAAGIGVTPAPRYDYHLSQAHNGATNVRDAFHIRCKSPTANRRLDVLAMEDVHRIKGLGL